IKADIAERECRDALRGEFPLDLGRDSGCWLILVVGGVGAGGKDCLKTVLQGTPAGFSHAIVALHPGHDDFGYLLGRKVLGQRRISGERVRLVLPHDQLSGASRKDELPAISAGLVGFVGWPVVLDVDHQRTRSACPQQQVLQGFADRSGRRNRCRRLQHVALDIDEHQGPGHAVILSPLVSAGTRPAVRGAPACSISVRPPSGRPSDRAPLTGDSVAAEFKRYLCTFGERWRLAPACRGWVTPAAQPHEEGPYRALADGLTGIAVLDHESAQLFGRLVWQS